MERKDEDINVVYIRSIEDKHASHAYKIYVKDTNERDIVDFEYVNIGLY